MKREVMELLEDPDFMEEVMEKEDSKSVKELFSEKGLELSLDEIDEIGKELYSSLVLAYRLSDDQSSEISGGNGPEKNQDNNKPPISQREVIRRQIMEIGNQTDTVKDIVNRNKGWVALGAVSLFVGSFYGLKTLIRYIENVKNKKNWIKIDEKTKK